MIQQELDFGFPDSVKIPDGAVFLGKTDWGSDCFSYRYFLGDKDTGKMVISTFLEVRYIPSVDKWISRTTTERNQKFLCVNGPQSGKVMTEREAKPFHYIRYIKADRRGNGRRNVLVCEVFLTPTGMVTME